MGQVRTFSAAPTRSRAAVSLAGAAACTANLAVLSLAALAALDLPSSSACARCSSTFFPSVALVAAADPRPFLATGATSCGGATGTFSGAGTGGSVSRGVNGVFSLGMSIAMLSEAGLGSGSSNIGTTIATISSSAAAPISLRRARTRTMSAGSTRPADRTTDEASRWSVDCVVFAAPEGHDYSVRDWR